MPTDFEGLICLGSLSRNEANTALKFSGVLLVGLTAFDLVRSPFCFFSFFLLLVAWSSFFGTRLMLITRHS
ncbi:hypothetical protein D3C74_243760 [compost metagenome]